MRLNPNAWVRPDATRRVLSRAIKGNQLLDLADMAREGRWLDEILVAHHRRFFDAIEVPGRTIALDRSQRTGMTGARVKRGGLFDVKRIGAVATGRVLSGVVGHLRIIARRGALTGIIPSGSVAAAVAGPSRNAAESALLRKKTTGLGESGSSRPRF